MGGRILQVTGTEKENTLVAPEGANLQVSMIAEGRAEGARLCDNVQMWPANACPVSDRLTGKRRLHARRSS